MLKYWVERWGYARGICNTRDSDHKPDKTGTATEQQDLKIEYLNTKINVISVCRPIIIIRLQAFKTSILCRLLVGLILIVFMVKCPYQLQMMTSYLNGK